MSNTPNTLFGGPLRFIYQAGQGHISVNCLGINNVGSCKMKIWLESDPSKSCESVLSAGPLPNTYYANAFGDCSGIEWPPAPDGPGPLFFYVELIIEIDGGNGDKVSRPLNVLLIDPDTQHGRAFQAILDC